MNDLTTPTPAFNRQDLLRSSWHRCEAEYGLESTRVHPIVLTSNELMDHRAPIEDLSAICTPEIERLLLSLKDYAQVIMLTDAKGVTIQFRCVSPASLLCDDLRLLPGAVWTEETQGTNGIGLCLRERSAISVVMAEHFAHRLTSLSCTAVPIFGEGEALSAVLNVTSVSHTSHELHGVLQNMVIHAARRIENAFFESRHRNRRIVRLSMYGNFSDTAAEDRVAIDTHGHIIDATPNAAHLFALASDLGHSPQSLIGMHLGNLVCANHLEQWLDQASPCIIGSGSPRIHARLLSPPSHRKMGMETSHPKQRHTQRPFEYSVQYSEHLETDAVSTQVIEKAHKVHACGLPILIQGETGTGKTQLARHLHNTGPFSRGSFVTINCAAIPAELIESELFGHRPGAYTGASAKGSPGRILAAQAGTLFLDEIGDMPIALQSRLLQVLSEGEFVPVGGIEPVAVEFALISASLHPLIDAVAQGRFREDLYYRLMGVNITLPPLRQRSDLDSMVCRAFARAARTANLPSPHLEVDAQATLAAYPWPGNLRELDHLARVTLALCRDPRHITREDLPENYFQCITPDTSRTSPSSTIATWDDAETLQVWLERFNWNVKATAVALGTSRATLHRRITRWKLQRSLRVQHAGIHQCPTIPDKTTKEKR